MVHTKGELKDYYLNAIENGMAVKLSCQHEGELQSHHLLWNEPIRLLQKWEKLDKRFLKVLDATYIEGWGVWLRQRHMNLLKKAMEILSWQGNGQGNFRSNFMNWSSRIPTTISSKLPADWE